MPDFTLLRDSEPDTRSFTVRFTGAGPANPTKSLGRGVTVTWISTGLYELTWAEPPGVYKTYEPSWQATTPSDLAGYTVVAGDFNATTRKLRLSVTNAANALADLTATQKLNLRVHFGGTSA